MFDPIERPSLVRLALLWERLRAKFVHASSNSEEADRQLDSFYERVWREAAACLGASVVSLGANVFEITLGTKRTRVWHNCSSIDDLANHHIVRMKSLMNRLLASHGLPVPRQLEFERAHLRKAAEFLETAGRACVVKPASGTGGGVGVVTGIRTRRELAHAAVRATAYGGCALIEEQVEGTNYRVLFLDGRLLDVVRRESPSVSADGQSTIRQLVQRANEARLRQEAAKSHDQLSINMDLHHTLREQGWTVRSVPPKGTLVKLKTVINENSSNENVTATHELCADILQEAGEAAELANLRLAGVDVLCADPTRSLRKGGGVILEVNSPPGYFWHYHKRDGVCPVALHVLRALFDIPFEPATNGHGSEAAPSMERRP